MDIVSKIVFFLTRKEYLVVFEKEMSSPEIEYRNGERYRISGYSPTDKLLKINRNSVRRVYPANSDRKPLSAEKVIGDLIVHMNGFNIPVECIE